MIIAFALIGRQRRRHGWMLLIPAACVVLLCIGLSISYRKNDARERESGPPSVMNQTTRKAESFGSPSRSSSQSSFRLPFAQIADWNTDQLVQFIEEKMRWAMPSYKMNVEGDTGQTVIRFFDSAYQSRFDFKLSDLDPASLEVVAASYSNKIFVRTRGSAKLIRYSHGTNAPELTPGLALLNVPREETARIGAAFSALIKRGGGTTPTQRLSFASVADAFEVFRRHVEVDSSLTVSLDDKTGTLVFTGTSPTSGKKETTVVLLSDNIDGGGTRWSTPAGYLIVQLRAKGGVSAFKLQGYDADGKKRPESYFARLQLRQVLQIRTRVPPVW
ncbi:MAG: hypothetical protein QOH88_3112 [Verrucomicrobiota bacterium]